MGIRTSVTLLLSLVLLAAAAVPPASAATYEGYNYSAWGRVVASPSAYEPSAVIGGAQMNAGALNQPEDLFVGDGGRRYIADTGNNRIVVANRDWTMEASISSFDNGGQEDGFSRPTGVYATEKGEIYVADSGNKRIVVLDASGRLLRIVEPPKSEILRQGFQYNPVKVAVDLADRLFVVSQGGFDGLVEFDADGAFQGFMGTNPVRVNLADYVWKRTFSTKKQREQMTRFIPVEFNNLDVDPDGFVYVTTPDYYSDKPVQRLNPTGKDVMRRNGYVNPVGEGMSGGTESRYAGFSIFADVEVAGYGIFHVLDTKRNRIFTYDEEGNLLYITGQPGNQTGTFQAPVAVETSGDELLILDKSTGLVTVFKTTEFGRAVNEAVKHNFEGNDEASAAAWKKVAKLNANYEIAYIGIGKSMLKQGEYKEAARYFRLGESRLYYSKAFKQYRKQQLDAHLGTIMTMILAAAVVLICGRWILKRMGRVKADARSVH